MDRMNLLVSDLDNTLLGDDDDLGAFSKWFEAERDQFRLVYTSGRFVESIMGSIERNGLPMPDAVVGGVGTEIYDVLAARRIVTWPPSVFEWNPYLVRSIGESFRELALQPEHFLSHYKVSFYGRDLDQSFLDHLMLHMTSAGLRINMIYSSRRDLDILPAESSKREAAAFLANRWQIDTERIIVAGDSGNDADMFRAEYRGIIVGNAQPELKFLKSPRIYHAKSKFAGGVLEGLRYWSRQPDFQKSCETQRRSTCLQKALSVFGEPGAERRSQDKRSWLPEANFPWMLI
jgi:sucrose-6F-phosphate phosphohydrolase